MMNQMMTFMNNQMMMTNNHWSMPFNPYQNFYQNNHYQNNLYQNNFHMMMNNLNPNHQGQNGLITLSVEQLNDIKRFIKLFNLIELYDLNICTCIV
jgi:hypothetical protein